MWECVGLIHLRMQCSAKRIAIIWFRCVHTEMSYVFVCVCVWKRRRVCSSYWVWSTSWRRQKCASQFITNNTGFECWCMCCCCVSSTSGQRYAKRHRASREKHVNGIDGWVHIRWHIVWLMIFNNNAVCYVGCFDAQLANKQTYICLVSVWHSILAAPHGSMYAVWRWPQESQSVVDWM